MTCSAKFSRGGASGSAGDVVISIGRSTPCLSGGTDNHLMLLDLTSKYEKLSGRQAADHLEDAGIIVNKNTIPFDKRKPKTTSGIRLGTPMVTTRGMKEDEMVHIADFITEALENRQKASIKQRIREKVQEFCEQFPIYEYLKV